MYQDEKIQSPVEQQHGITLFRMANSIDHRLADAARFSSAEKKQLANDAEALLLKYQGKLAPMSVRTLSFLGLRAAPVDVSTNQFLLRYLTQQIGMYEVQVDSLSQQMEAPQHEAGALERLESGFNVCSDTLEELQQDKNLLLEAMKANRGQVAILDDVSMFNKTRLTGPLVSVSAPARTSPAPAKTATSFSLASFIWSVIVALVRFFIPCIPEASSESAQTRGMRA